MIDSMLDIIARLLVMLLIHVVDDFGIQHLTQLNDTKQKLWWIKQCAIAKAAGIDTYKYRFDYVPCLILHAFKWSMLITIPFLTIAIDHTGIFVVTVVINTLIHAITDHYKANLFKINLIQDQLIHLIQIVMTTIIWSFA